MARASPEPPRAGGAYSQSVTYQGEVWTLIDITCQGSKFMAHLIPSTLPLSAPSTCVFVDLTEVQT